MYILYVNISEYQEKKTVNMHLWNKLFKIGTIQNVKKVALTGVAQWVGCPPADHMATGFILVRAHVWVAGSVHTDWGSVRGNPWMFLLHIDVSLPLSPSFHISLKINK